MSAARYEIHPLARLVPEMSAEQFAELRDDIAVNGLREAIVLYDGQVLDGRHRLRACEEAGAEPRFRTYDGDQPATFVVSLNLKRRHLTASERAVVAVELLPELEREAKQRQGTRTDLSTSPPQGGEVAHPAVNEAAAAVGVSPRIVERAKRVARDDPEAFEQVRRGDLTVGRAEREIKDRRGTATTGATAHNRANAARERVNKAMHTLNGMCLGLEEVDVGRATELATTDEIDHWVRTLAGATRTLRRLRAAITREGSIHGIEERSPTHG